MAAGASGYQYPDPHPITHDHESDPFSPFGASNAQHPYTPLHRDAPHSFYNHSHTYQATTLSTISSQNFLNLNPSLLEPTLSRVAAAPSHFSTGTEPPTSPTFMNHNLPPEIATDPNFVPYMAEPYKKRPRGTTGTIVCDECGKKFTVLPSLHRHKKICRGKNPTKKPPTTRRKITKAKDVRLTTTKNGSPSSAMSSTIETPEDESQFGRLESDSFRLSAASTPIDSPGAERATPVSSPATTMFYVPRPLDTSVDHREFFCDLCTASFERRDMLQMHKASTHSLTEIGYLPDNGAIGLPPYLIGITPNTGSKQLRAALGIFERGGLSTSPCQPCLLKGMDCIVSPFSSSYCCYCIHRGHGVYCGAAGVKWAKPRRVPNHSQEFAATQDKVSMAAKESEQGVMAADSSVSLTVGNIKSDLEKVGNVSPQLSGGYQPVSYHSDQSSTSH